MFRRVSSNVIGVSYRSCICLIPQPHACRRILPEANGERYGHDPVQMQPSVFMFFWHDKVLEFAPRARGSFAQGRPSLLKYLKRLSRAPRAGMRSEGEKRQRSSVIQQSKRAVCGALPPLPFIEFSASRTFPTSTAWAVKDDYLRASLHRRHERSIRCVALRERGFSQVTFSPSTRRPLILLKSQAGRQAARTKKERKTRTARRRQRRTSASL